MIMMIVIIIIIIIIIIITTTTITTTPQLTWTPPYEELFKYNEKKQSKRTD